MSNLYRYPGIHPFGPQDQDLFFGRNEEKKKLFNAILLNQVTVITGRSGIGKSSLIDAGLLPKIEKEINRNEKETRNFRLLRIRVGYRKINDDSTLLKKVLQTKSSGLLSCDQGTDSATTENSFLPFLSTPLKETLWYKFKQLQYQSLLSKKNTIYLFFFDQLEELFSYPAEEFRELVTGFSQLLSPNPPEAVREAISEYMEKNSASLPSAEQKALDTPVPVKFLFAIRSDKISQLFRLLDAIPSILQNPYELRPLSRDQAREAIIKPTELKGDFEKNFSFDSEAVDAICQYLEERPYSDPEMLLENLRIEPFALQIICSHIEQNLDAVDENHDAVIERPEVSRLDGMIEQFYLDQLEEMDLDDETYLRLRDLIEERMIDNQYRRKKIMTKEELKDFSDDIISDLVKRRLLRQVPGLGREAYEISHDFLIEPILHAKELRQQSRKKASAATTTGIEKFDETLAELQEQIRKNPNAYNSYKRLGDYYYFLQEFEKAIGYYTEAINKYTETANKKSSPDIAVADLELYFSRGYCYYRMDKYDASLSDFDKVLQLQPDHLLANFYCGSNYHKMGSLEKAIECYNKVVAIDKNYVDAYYNLGILYRELMLNKKSEAQTDENKTLSQQSEDCFKMVISLNPSDYEAYYYLGLLAREGAQPEPEKALGYFDQVLSINPKYTAAFDQKALVYAEQNNLDSALQCYKKILEIEPESARTYKNLGIVYKSQKNIPEAKRHFYEATRLNKVDYEPFYYLGVIANDQLDYEDALNYLNTSIALNKLHVNSYIEKAYALTQLSLLDEALAVYDEVLEMEPENALAHKGIQMIKGDYESEEHLLQKVTENPEDFSSWYTLGVQANNTRQYDKAVDYLSKAQELKPDDINTLIEQGYAYTYLQDDNKAIDCYLMVLRLDPENRLAIRSLAAVFYSKRDYTKAKEYFSKAAQLDPNDHNCFYFLGLIARNEKELATALNYFEEALKRNPLSKEILIQKGYVLDQLGKTEEAINCYQEIIKIDPAYADAYANLGILYNKSGKADKAEEHYLQAVELNDQDYESYYDLAVIAKEKKNFKKAIEYVEKAIDIKPSFVKALNFLADFYMQLREYEKATKLYNRIIELDPNNSDAFYNLGQIHGKQLIDTPKPVAAMSSN
jgi:tetratricopeptide (TPR) repeat protein